MFVQGEVDVALVVGDREVVLRGVPYSGEVSVDPGCRTLPCGDPGYPPSAEFDVSVDMTVAEIQSLLGVTYDLGRRILESLNDAALEDAHDRCGA